MNEKAEIIKDLKKAMEFYQCIGFKHFPLKNIQFPPEHDVTVDSPKGVSDKAEALAGLRSEIGDCMLCRLSKGRKNIVFGDGSPDAELMFVGEGPGREEDIQALPFVGEAGKVLTSLIKKMGFSRTEVYIANIVKCRPPSNRDPEEDEMNMCSPFLDRQIEIIQPKVIVALGRIASQVLVGSKIPISRLRGQFYAYRDIPVMPTFHPAYLMRNPKDKWLTWDDAQKVLERLKN